MGGRGLAGDHDGGPPLLGWGGGSAIYSTVQGGRAKQLNDVDVVVCLGTQGIQPVPHR